jgi:GH25 family lysozyme M1 (1,4-beta-N-acetylmuramidase)
VTDVDTALIQQVFDVSERQEEVDVQHYCQADDSGAGFEVLER